MFRGWFHITWGTYGSWLPGDHRGFKNRDHRIHSSGDYRTPPPPAEHAGLNVHAKVLLKRDPVIIPQDLRDTVRALILEKAFEIDVRIAVIAVCGMHVHVFLRPVDAELDAMVGKLKRHSSHGIRNRIPGTVWAAGCDKEPVTNDEHAKHLFAYILGHQAEGAAVWRWRETELDPPFDPTQTYVKPLRGA